MFETFTLPRAPRNRVAGPAAVLLHGAAVAGTFLLTAWKVGDIGAPPIPIVFPRAPVPQSSAAPFSTGRSEAAKAGPRIPSSRPAILQPDSIGPMTGAPAAPEASSDPEMIPGAEGSGNRAVEGSGEPAEGTFSGDGDDPLLSANAPNVAAPRLLSQAQPEYPELSRRMKEQGVVVLQAVIGLDGRVEDVRILRGATELLDSAAVRAVRQWRYAPATMNGATIRVFLTATVRFTLH